MQFDRTSRRLPRPLLTEKGLILSLFTLYILATSAITVLSFNASQAQQLATTRSMLLTAARAGGHIVGKYFHDNYRQSSPPGEDHYRLLVEALDDLVNDLPGVEYVYSMDVVEGEAYFVISNETQDDLERGTPSRFYNPYRSAPDALYNAYRTREPVFTPVYSNEWGSFRSAFVPTKRFDDTYYIMAADIKVDGRRDLFMHSLRTAAIVSLIALLPVYLLFLFYRRLQRLRAEELERQLYCNPLTGLPNTAWLTREEGEACSAVSGILLNINNFHAINMLFGREAGDKLIQRIAQCLQAQLPPGGQLSHLEVDEFLLVSSEAELDTLISQARQLLAAVFMPPDDTTSARFAVSARAGIAGGCDSIKSLLSRTRQAMKQAAVLGVPLRVYTGSDSPDQYYERNLHWLNEAGQALAEGRLKPWFQPIRDIHSGAVQHYEALARLVGRDREVYLPGQFLPAIRCSHLYPLLTRSMIEQSLASFRDRDEMVAINMSKQDLLDEQTMSYLFETLQAYGMEGRVMIEVLESDSIEYQDDVVGILSHCRQMGVKVAIDDFGSGYSNFDRILKIEPDYLKIDGSLICRIDEDEASRVLVAAICQFAVSLNIPLIAEFVESERLLPLLEEMGVSLAQGFGIGRPAPLISGAEAESE